MIESQVQQSTSNKDLYILRIYVVDAYSNPLGWTPEFEPILSSLQAAAKGTRVNVASVESVSLRDVRRANKTLANILSKRKRESLQLLLPAFY